MPVVEPGFELGEMILGFLFLSTKLSWFKREGDEVIVFSIPATIHSTNICEPPTSASQEIQNEVVLSLGELGFQHLIPRVCGAASWRCPESGGESRQQQSLSWRHSSGGVSRPQPQ